MANPFGYRFLLAAEAYRDVLNLRASDREILDDTFQYLADNPRFGGDHQEQNEDGRPREVFLRGRFLATFWADHAAKEIRVVRVERD